MNNLHYRSLGEQVSRNISNWILILVIAVITSVSMVSMFQSRQMFIRQVETWREVLLQQAITSLIDSDHFSISREAKLLHSTRLFSSFYITDNQRRIVASFGSNDFSNDDYIPIKDDAGVVWGYYALKPDFYQFSLPFVEAGLLFFAIITVLYFFIRSRIRNSLDLEFARFHEFLNEIEMLTDKIQDIYQRDDGLTPVLKENHHAEQILIHRAVSRLLAEIMRAKQALKEAVSAAEQKRFQDELTATALQVAHDIGSPLATLEAIVQSASLSLSEESRVAIRNAATKMRDITNTLLKKAKYDVLSVYDGMITQHALHPLVSQIVTEKRLQYSDAHGINLQCVLNTESYALFATIRSTELCRILANLINNSVEALDGAGGDIIISLSQIQGYSVIAVKDNGKGIPKYLIEKLGQLGMSYGKSDGHGLGLFHAKTTIENWGGRLEIQSDLGRGAVVSLYIPKVQAPVWFVTEIKVYHRQAIVVIDDDESIHDIWRHRFNDSNSGKQSIQLLHFKSPGEWLDWYQRQDECRHDILYLWDYEFVNTHQVGLDMIVDHGLQYKSILVTSRFDRDDIIHRCEAENIKLLPKELAGVVPIVAICEVV